MMINSKKALKDCLALEETLYKEIGYKGKFHAFITQCEVGKIVQFMKALRKDEYYSNTYSGPTIKKIIALYYRRKHNILGHKLGISIPINTFKKGLVIYHSQSIIVHKDARCGEFCKLHGIVCIGNNGKEEIHQINTPQIGDHVDIGVGVSVIGGICLADNVKIAAGGVVCKSCEIKGAVLAGVPAKVISQ